METRPINFSANRLNSSSFLIKNLLDLCKTSGESKHRSEPSSRQSSLLERQEVTTTGNKSFNKVQQDAHNHLVKSSSGNLKSGNLYKKNSCKICHNQREQFQAHVVDLRVDRTLSAGKGCSRDDCNILSGLKEDMRTGRQVNQRQQQQSSLKQSGKISAPNKRHRIRTMFSDWQLASLEWRFAKNKYLTASDRTRIATMLQLNQLQVKTWFQVSWIINN